MYILRKDIKPGVVIWGDRNIYYDDPTKILHGRKSMYVITMVNEDHFYGCPLTVNKSGKNCTILSTKHYPIKQDSRITECLYKLSYSDIVSDTKFTLTEGTFEHFKRSLYKRIILGSADSPKEYNEIYVNEYLKEHVPRVNDILVYPSEEKQFKFYYLYDQDDENYICVSLNQEKDKDKYLYSIEKIELINIPKSIRFFDYFTKHSLNRDTVEEALGAKVKVKSIGCYPKK